ncbi:MAG: hypothetical protein D6682_08390 [Zetaproteobacteria bacterium]|nr:MAG: hypothetical protein D6682_08390 [Zetaproteobacteria bacterium]
MGGWPAVAASVVLGAAAASAAPASSAPHGPGAAGADAIASQHALTPAEQRILARAIEDFQFQEQKKAIAALEPLRKRHPTNLEVLRYLGRAYEESGRYAEAQGAFAQWIRYSGNRMDDDARFAWVGMAKSYDKTGHTGMAIKLLRRWLSRHPHDDDAQVALGDMLVRQNEFDAARALFRAMLARPDLAAGYQASAHYYLGLLAWLEGDVGELQAEGARVLRVEPEGGFAGVIKQLMKTPPPRRLGLNATAGLNAFYVDNVATKPSYNIKPSEHDRTPGINPTLGLTWNFRHHLSASYNFSGTFYSRRPDLDLGLHMFGLTWADGGLQIGPRFEYVTMYDKKLYRGVGADVGYAWGRWILIDSLRFKAFTHAAKVLDPVRNTVLWPDLSYLTSWNNTLMLMRQARWGRSIWMFGANFVAERTHGNAKVDHKINDYRQLGGTVSVRYPDGALIFHADLNGYIKKYRGVDPKVLDARRKDEYIHVGGGITWHPDGRNRHALELKTEWNNNNSNYDFPNDPARMANGAAYSQWKHTVGYSFVW